MTTSWPPSQEASQNRGRRLSVEEWGALDEGEPGELVRGALEGEEMPDAVHELAVSYLMWVLRSWLGPKGFVFGSELKLLVAPSTGRKPDVSVFLPGTPAPPGRGVVSSPPDIVVEVVSPSPRDERRDRVEKMDEYARFGVRLYLLIDPALGACELFERSAGGQYTRVAAAMSGQLGPVPGCSGLVLDVDALWAELARLREGA